MISIVYILDSVMAVFRYLKFGNSLKLWRKTLKIPVTQHTQARKVGVTDGFIVHIETNRTLHGKDDLCALAKSPRIPETNILTREICQVNNEMS
jgi:DNA-binding XRE family transcriptional regulator